MFTALEIERELLKRDVDAKFIATGQTGIMVSGNGIPIDSVVSDFVNGSIENLVLANQQHDFLLIEGQGSVVHPAYSAVTLGLLHGCAPHGLILCYEAGRTHTKGLDHVPLKSLSELRTIYELIASTRNPCEVIGVALNGRRISEEDAAIEKEKVTAELGLPVCDVYRDGPQLLADAVIELGKKMPLKNVFRISRGAISVQECVIVELHDQGESGLGEAPRSTYYGHAVDSITKSLEAIQEELEAWEFTTPETLWDFAQKRLANDYFALSALDQAAHDLYGKRHRSTVFERKGFAWRDIPYSSVTVSIASIPEMLKELASFSGWPIIKVKLGTENDLEIIQAL
ncbi:unnamed protein product, partial [Symbiodinium microadriaticum]